MIPKLGKVKRIDVRDAWMNEASDFTPWLASEEGMELLQEVLDMELEVEATEKFVGPFKADILAKRTDTTDDHWVLVENQLERTDHRHLGQLLTYAAGLDAATIVWVAERFCEEHRAALDWLNDITSEKFEFFGLEVELWQIEGSPPAPMFSIAAQPNEWAREVKQTAEANVSDLRQQQMSYWQHLRALMVEQKTLLRPQKAQPQSWASFAIGRSGAWIGACVNSQSKNVWVELCVMGPPGKVWFDELFAQKDAIEAEVGQALDWRRLEGKKTSKIVLLLENADPTDEADWPRQHRWLMEQLERFRQAFQDRARALSGEGPTGHDLPTADETDEG